jgi:hypothetical protein
MNEGIGKKKGKEECQKQQQQELTWTKQKGDGINIRRLLLFRLTFFPKWL